MNQRPGRFEHFPKSALSLWHYRKSAADNTPSHFDPRGRNAPSHLARVRRLSGHSQSMVNVASVRFRARSCCQLRIAAGLPPIVLLALSPLLSAAEPKQPSPEQRAVVYLSKEVPAWSRENHCFSCHNNGDAARALFAAKRLSHSIQNGVLDETIAWLARPSAWDSNRGEPGFSDKKLARIQFAAALADALDTGLLGDKEGLIKAAEMLLPDQAGDGSWQVDAGNSLGSPVTYGPALATRMARRTLLRARRLSGDDRFGGSLSLADEWLLKSPVKSVIAAAALILAHSDSEGLGNDEPAADEKLRAALETIAAAQTSDGGWGPFKNSPPEPFDAALALLSLAELRGTRNPADDRRIENLIVRGRAFLIKTQLPAGGWPETTRPPGMTSYAQHVSTSGWATLALLRTSD